MRRSTGHVRSFTLSGLPGAEVILGDGIVHEFRRHIHATYLIGAVARGERIIEHAQGAASITPGGLFLLNPGQVHACTSGGAATGHCYKILSLTPRIMHTMLMPTHGQGDRLPHFSTVLCPSELLFTEFLQMVAWLEQDGSCDEQRQRVAAFLKLLIRWAVQEERLGSVRVECSRRLVKQACAYIREHFSDNIDNRDLAQRAGVSLFHFQREFKKYLGITPQEYVHAYRVFQAKRMLLVSPDIGDVALRAGFFDQSHFTKIFKRTVGVSPGTFQKIQQGR